jgi:FKBP-type peptidyl-prolyl cis-trans isomerase FkpA
MKRALCFAAAAVLVAACATPENKPPTASAATARSGCEPAPRTLVKKDLKEGDGRIAVPLSTAMVFYTGWLYEPCAPDHKGTQFDSNVGRRVPYGFRVGAGTTIKGWDEGVPGMKEGGKRLLIIPADMAYGDKAAGDKIPPNSTLVFEVQLVLLNNIPGAPAPSAPARPQ